MHDDSFAHEMEPGPPKAKSGAAKPLRSILWRWPWGAAKLTTEWVVLIFGPLTILVLTLTLLPTAIGAGAGRGFGLHPSVMSGVWMVPAITFIMAIYIAPIVFLAAAFSYLRGKALSIPWRRPEAIATPTAPRRRWRVWRGIIACLTVLMGVMLILASLVGIYVGGYVDTRLASAIAATDRDDPNWRLDDILNAREPVPDDENAAIVVAEVVARLPAEGWPPTEAPVGPGRLPSEASQAYQRIADALPRVRLDDQAAKFLRDDLRAHEDAVLLARTLANYARGRHELEIGPAIIDTLLGETQAARTPARLLVSDATLRAHDGDIDGALESCRAIFGVARSIGDEPTLISMLVRIAIEGVATQAVRRTLAQGEPSDAELAKLQRVILDERAVPILLRGFAWERASLDEIIRRIRDAEISISAISEGGDTSPGRVPQIAPWGKLMFDNQRAVGLEWTQDMLDIARLPVAQRAPKWKAWDAEIDRERKTRLGPFAATLPVLMMPASRATEVADSRYKSVLGATAILLAAERHRLKTGAWPKTVAEIDPAILPEPPLDLFTDAPYLIEHSDGEFRVYSIGPNLIDEHGDYNPRERNLWDGKPGVRDDYGTSAWDVPMRRQAPEPPGKP